MEILSDATLRLKDGNRYALIGRNGTGKSSKFGDGLMRLVACQIADHTALLRAIAEKLIPGIPEEARISILQQTNDNDDGVDAKANRRTVLEEVIERATAKDELEQEIQSKLDSKNDP